MVVTAQRIPVIAALLAAMSLAAAAARAEPLIATSPFLPANAPAATVPTATTDGPIQLSSVMFGMGSSGDLFGIFNPALKRATFVKLNERGSFTPTSAPFTVRASRVVDGVPQVTVDYQGQQLVLALKPSKVASSTAPGARGAPNPVINPTAAPAARGGQPGGPGGPGGRGQPTATADQVANATALFQQTQAQRQAGQPVTAAGAPGGRAGRGGDRGGAVPATGAAPAGRGGGGGGVAAPAGGGRGGRGGGG